MTPAERLIELSTLDTGTPAELFLAIRETTLYGTLGVLSIAIPTIQLNVTTEFTISITEDIVRANFTKDVYSATISEDNTAKINITDKEITL